MKSLRVLPAALVLLFLTSCSSFPGRLFVPTVLYAIGGSISGLVGSGLTLRDNGASDLRLSAGASSFTFGRTIAAGGRYDVTIASQPAGPWQTCAVSNGSGTVGSADVANVQITCTTNQYTIGGNISMLTGTGLVLQDNGGDNISISPGATNFTFPTTIANGGSYNVTIFSQPSEQNCAVSNGAGTVAGANVTNVQITCTTNKYTIGGSISGLSGTGLVLQDNGGDNLSISPGATTFTFATPIASGGSYDVTVLMQPPLQTCGVANGSGVVARANITTVQVTCTPSASSTFAYVSNQNSDTISGYLVSADGALTALPSSPFPAGGNPAELAVDRSGKFLYVANVLTDNVSGYSIAPDGSLSPIPGSPFPAASGAISVAIDPTGNYLYVPSCGADCSGSGPGSIVAFSITPGTGVLVPVPGSPFPAGIFPYEMVFVTPGATGTFAYASSNGSSSISGFKIQPDGALSPISGSPFAAGTRPLSLAVDVAFNRLYAVNTGSSTVTAYSVHLDGSLVEFSTIGTGAFSGSAVVDANEHLYVTDASGVLGFATNAFPATPIPGSPFAAGLAPFIVRIDPSGQFLYAVNERGDSVWGYSTSASTGQLTPIPGSPFPTGALPYSIAFAAPPSSAVTWYLDNVQFGSETASGYFTYDAKTNVVSNIHIVSGSATFTQIAATFPVNPFEFVFVPSGTLTYGVPEPALVLIAAPNLTNAGGVASLTGMVGISIEGLICDNACDGVVIGAQALTGSSLTSTPLP